MCFVQGIRWLEKVGYGGHSTVWLCRDLQQHVYATLKMYDLSLAMEKEKRTFTNILEASIQVIQALDSCGVRLMILKLSRQTMHILTSVLFILL
ncbi:protein kinase [Penicillium malachiteum]|nr:protein kinase [Penicillium malachiteum]